MIVGGSPIKKSVFIFQDLKFLLKERKMNMGILQIISVMGIFFYLALFIANFKIQYEMYKLEKYLKETEQDKTIYEIWLEDILSLK